jgi:polysaccharide chain length determinant protein (PEP-CTERM system associated)
MFSGAGDLQATSALDERIHILNKRLDELLLKYTERHPDVIEIRNTISYLKRKRQKEIASAASMDAPQRGLETSPVYQQMRTMLAETEARIAALQVRVEEYEKRAEKLTSVVDSIPKIEAELQQLNRDYQVVSQQHAAILKRRESARLGERMERNADDVKFRVVDPPFVPSKPQEPNKLLLNVIVLVGGIGAGIALGLLMSILRPVFDDRRTLNKVTGLPVLGSVTLVLTAAQKRQALVGTLSYVSLFGVLLLTFVGLILIADSGVDLPTNIAGLRARFL